MDEQMIKIWATKLKENEEKIQAYRMKLYVTKDGKVDMTADDALALSRIIMDLQGNIRCLHDEAYIEHTVDAHMKRLGQEV